MKYISLFEREDKKMLQFCTYIYFIFAFVIIIQVKCSTEPGNSTAELGSLTDAITEEKCDSNVTFCSCDDIRKKLLWVRYGLTCDDYSKVINITIENPGYLPAGILPGFRIISMVILFSPFDVNENVFEKISGIAEFKVRESSIKIIPDFNFVKDSIEVIEINQSRILSLEGKRNLQGLRLVKKLIFCKNSLQSIHPDVFKGTDNVEEIDLSYNSLTSIPSKLLDPMKNLHSFSASHNNLLQVDQLFSVTHPKIIRLNFNRITSANRTLHFDYWRSVSYIILKDEISTDFELVDLSNNSIENVPTFLCSFEDDTVDVGGTPVCRVRHLILAGNKLQNLAKIGYARIQELDISQNEIQHLAHRDFARIEDTTFLKLHRNQIQRIEAGVFSHFKSSLRYLDLNSNKISSVNGSMKYLSQLKYLNLANNFIQSLSKYEFVGANELSELYLQHNQMKAVGMLQQLINLRHLDISYNSIESIRPDDLPNNLRKLILAGNPLKCNCNLQPFIDHLSATILQTDTDVCSIPNEGHRLQNKTNCPDYCSCRCTSYKGDSFMFVDCSSRNLSVVPQIFSKNFIQMEDSKNFVSDGRPLVIYQNIYKSLHIDDIVLGISLENNNLESLDSSQLPPNLILLYLSNNKLRQLDEDVLNSQENLKHVSLSGNPWMCDCKALKFKKWLTSRIEIGAVRDADSIHCGKRNGGEKNKTGIVLWKLNDDNFCPTIDLTLILSVPFGVFALVTFCVLLYEKYELSVKIFLYSIGLTFVKEEDVDYDKYFDAFLSFSHNDDEFVIKEIISVIERKEPNIRLCFSYRNFVPGELIFNNITRAVENSKRTVFILSKNFLESEWCLLEFKVAHTQALADKVHRIILIKFGDLPKDIDPDIDLYLKSTTYLVWGEKNFWKKLLFILPNNCNFRKPVPTHTCYDIFYL